jgi:hypothetical protein
MKDIAFAIGVGVYMGFKALFVVIKGIALGLFWSASQIVPSLALRGSNISNPVKATQVTAVARIDVPMPGAKAQAEGEDVVRGPATVFMNDFEAADRIVSMKLDPPVGSIHLRVYHRSRTVKRELIISEPRLRALLGARRIDLGDITYDPALGLEDIKDGTVQKAEDMMNEKGNHRVRAIKPPKADFVRSGGQSKPNATSTPVQPAQPAAPVHPPASQPTVARATEAPKQPTGKLVAPTVKTGVTYQGELISAGPKRCEPRGKPAYEVFEATLRLDNGAEMALRGAELERALVKASCDLGNRIAVTPMGKIPVELGDGSEGKKNLYAVANLSNSRG